MQNSKDNVNKQENKVGDSPVENLPVDEKQQEQVKGGLSSGKKWWDMKINSGG